MGGFRPTWSPGKSNEELLAQMNAQPEPEEPASVTRKRKTKKGWLKF